MRIGTLALALALGCGVTAMAEARQKPATHKVSIKKDKRYKASRASKVKPRKAKRVKSHRPPHR